MAEPMSFEEIAEAEGISVENARQVFHRAMNKLTHRMPEAYHRQGMRALRQLRNAGTEDGYRVRPHKKAA